MIVFGGVDPETNFELKESAFQEGVLREAWHSAWGKVGAALLTKACLNDKKVCKSIGSGDAEYDHLLTLIQEANDLATHTLTECGYNGSALKGKVLVVE